MLFIISVLFSAISLSFLVYVLLSPSLNDAHQQTTYFKHFRWLFPWVNVLSLLVMPFLSWRYQKNIEKLIETAGYKDKVWLKEIVGLQAVGGMVGMGLWGILWVQITLPYGLGLLGGITAAWIGGYLPIAWLKRKRQERKLDMLKAFPFFLDMVTLCVEAGSNLQTALMVAMQSMRECALRDELQHAINDMRTGTGRIEALKAMAVRCDLAEVKQWVSSLAQAELLGTSLGVVLRAQSDQFRQERFLRAEKQAAKTPVKLLFPLICFIFPCTFIVIGFPIVMKLLAMDLF